MKAKGVNRIYKSRRKRSSRFGKEWKRFMDQMKIGRFIAACRKEKGMTQKELAKQVGVSDKAVSKWECGNGMPELSILMPLCQMLR